MNFQELLDNPTYLISGNKINSKEREKNYMLGDDFPSLSPGASIESKRDLLRQLDQLKEKQQKLISDRIKLLEQRMQIEGYELPNDTMNTEKDLPNEQTTRQIQGINKTASKKQVISTKTSDTSHKADLDDAKSLIKQGKASLALSRLKSLDESAKKISEYHFLTGRAYQELKLNTESLESYSLAIHINPDNDKYWINRGLIKGALKDPQGSLKDLTKALSIRESSQAYLNRGVTNASLNNLSTAIEDLNNAIQLDPNYSQAYRNRGIIHKHRGDKYTACTDWKKAHQLGDSEVKTWIDAYCTKQSS
ncbi:tetratricopeptide repeat protein [Synechococcus sp. RS9907]|uniref:tetratricopeptide repeat protein n=1 Tax=Synechococcus sp. RS9907 TaxID=221350 RepID=UPI00165D70F9|nr:tetratricopeptide repeat protein [Synechococcus sp. RS9907]